MKSSVTPLHSSLSSSYVSNSNSNSNSTENAVHQAGTPASRPLDTQWSELQNKMSPSRIKTVIETARPQQVSRPFVQALMSGQRKDIQQLLEKETDLSFSKENFSEMWSHAVREDRVDMACALLLKAPASWIQDLYDNKDDVDIDENDVEGQSLLHQAFRLNNKTLNDVLKACAYSSEKHALGQNVNGRARFPNRQAIQCNSLTAFWVLLRFEYEHARQQNLAQSGLPQKHFDSSAFQVKYMEPNQKMMCIVRNRRMVLNSENV